MLSEQVYDVPVSNIKIAEENARREAADNGDLQELADSINLHGQLQPVVLRGKHDNPPYKLIIGQRRFLAITKVLKKKTIKATFCGDITDTDAAIRSLAENMCRVELSYKDTARAVTKLYKDYDRDDRKVAKVTGLSLQRVRQYIYIEERASEKTKTKLRQKKVKAADVKRALRAASDDVAKADELLDLMSQYDTHAKARAVEYGQTHPKASAKEIIEKAKDPIIERQFLVKLSDKVREALMTAAKQLSMAPDEVAAQAVEEWLVSKGFVQ